MPEKAVRPIAAFDHLAVERRRQQGLDFIREDPRVSKKDPGLGVGFEFERRDGHAVRPDQTVGPRFKTAGKSRRDATRIVAE